MEEKNLERNETVIDLQRVVSAVLNKIWLVALVPIVCAVVTFLGTFYLITPKYSAAAMFYVNNSNFSLGDTSLSISSSDITASKNLVNSYIVILKTRETLTDVIDYAGVDVTYKELSEMISASSVSSTEIFRVIVTSPDPEEATKLVNAIEYILPNRIKDIIEGTSAKVVDTAVTPTTPSSPDYVNNTLIGFLVGLVATVALIVLKEVFDIKIRTEEDISLACRYPILAAVPDMASPSKGSYYYYGYGTKRKQERQPLGTQEEPKLIGAQISFSASEAYKRLRTKLQFSFSDDSNSRVIGISSALTGEGKSLSAINLAYMLSQLDKKVILIDCDMRRPSLAAKLSLEKAPGLSSFLSGQNHIASLIQKCGLPNEEDAFDVVAAGRNPPNPIELLSSDRMNKMLSLLREKYDYIILDLPPVSEVSDALAVAKVTDGMLMVVRQHYCNRLALADTVRQFAFVDAKILGVIYNCTSETDKSYGYRKGYYKHYYRKYYKRYEGSYAASGKAAKKAVQNTAQDGE